jgi:hypothetical protein
MARTILVLLFALFAQTSSANDSLWNTSLSSSLPRNQQVHLAVLLPSKPIDETSERSTQILATTLPVIELAIRAVEKKRMLEGVKLKINFR